MRLVSSKLPENAEVVPESSRDRRESTIITEGMMEGMMVFGIGAGNQKRVWLASLEKQRAGRAGIPV